MGIASSEIRYIRVLSWLDIYVMKMLTKGYLVGKIDKKTAASSKKDTIFGGHLKQIFGPSF